MPTTANTVIATDTAGTRLPLIAGNWKMHKTAGEGAILVQNLEETAKEVHSKVEVAVAPPFTALQSVSNAIHFDKSSVRLAAQNMHWKEDGAYTGEISPLMLVNLHVGYVIIGHSERREYFAETNATTNLKVKAALKHQLVPILCCGESEEMKESGTALNFIATQIHEGLAGVQAEDANALVIAYEPIWAIGTGKTATPHIAEEVCAHIRSVLTDVFDATTAQQIRILYGGSVKAENAALFFAEPNIDGALVGGAALTTQAFVPIIKAAARL